MISRSRRFQNHGSHRSGGSSWQPALSWECWRGAWVPASLRGEGPGSFYRGLLFCKKAADYANHIYRPPGISVPQDVKGLLETFRGQSIGATDVAISLAVSQRAFGIAQQVSILPARSVQLKDFRTDDNFVILGSPRSDPWVSLFQDRFDFQFVYDAAKSRGVVRNRKPHEGEQDVYTPSAKGWGTGQAFGVVSFIANPNQSGHVLLLAGSSAEATDAASKFALNPDLVTATLKANGITPGGSPVSFQVLLGVNTMAGSANTFEVLAFHLL